MGWYWNWRNLVIKGRHHADHLTGTDGTNWICAKGGDDKIWAKGGNDYVDGGDGNDWIDGGKGCDVMDGGTGNDVIKDFEAGLDSIDLSQLAGIHSMADLDIHTQNSWYGAQTVIEVGDAGTIVLSGVKEHELEGWDFNFA